MHVVGGRANQQVAVDIRAEAPCGGTTLFPCRDKVYGSHTGLRECSEGRGQGYDL
jgi:hypothetical protein